MPITQLKLTSANEDLDGNWTKDEVEEQIREVYPDKDIEPGDWIDWVLGHLFIGDGYEASDIALQAIADPRISSVTFVTNGGYQVRADTK